MADSPEAIKKTQKLYLMIGAILFVFTVVTVAVATQPWLDFGQHGFDAADMRIGLGIATIKAGLVAAIFMHLSNEKKTIYGLIILGVLMVMALMLLTGWAYRDRVRYGDWKKGDKFYNPEKVVE
jgi:caa(3)-type oxidase subunit IV